MMYAIDSEHNVISVFERLVSVYVDRSHLQLTITAMCM